ncbi:MAG TPA: hypothetical protein VFD49_07550 [Candidatus Dormibacteraeota bacterium]|nr:hypothetical protein [Candidatus Dormibacteraeota bacterium]
MTDLLNQREGLLDHRHGEGFADRVGAAWAPPRTTSIVVADRMGKRGMAWTPAVARRMNKVLEASASTSRSVT